jgi:hypothetical protein
MSADVPIAGSVVKKYSSRWVPSRSRTNTQRIGTRPRPDLYQGSRPLAVSTRRVPPPYQPTDRRFRRPTAETASLGLGRLAPLTGGRPWPR